MKRTLTLINAFSAFLVFASTEIVGQSLERQVIGNLGGTSTVTATLNFTVGEPLVLAFTAGNNSLNQGFHAGFSHSGTFYWTGDVNTDWNTTGNWSSNAVPSMSDNATIPAGTPVPFVNTANNTVKNLNVLGNGSLIVITPGNSMTVEEDCYIENIVLVSSNAGASSSFIVKGTTTSKNATNLVYQRYVTDQWHLIGAPVSNQKISDFKDHLVRSGNKYALAPYENGLNTDRWDYYTDNTGSNDIDLAGNFTLGKGYTVQKITPDVFEFFGSIRNHDLLGYPITDGEATSGNLWNLLSNPFPSFMAINNNASLIDNFLTENTANLDPSFVAIYIWNPVASVYEIINHLNSASYLAPGQGFFIKSKHGGGSINITKAMQSHQVGDLFYRNNTSIAGITLSMSNGNLSKSTEIKFVEGTTAGLDPGFDAGMYGQINPDFDLYSHLITESNGVPFALQCVSQIENSIVPIGMHARAGDDITFSAIKNLPDGVNIFLEDRHLGLYISLNEESDKYQLTIDSDQTGIDRFYIHTTSQNLSIDDNVTTNRISIYKTSTRSLRIQGLQNGRSIFRLYSILGKRIMHTSFESIPIKDIKLPENLTKGIYFAHVMEQGIVYLKKIVLD